MTIPTIKIATADDEAAVIDVLVLAFDADPAARWSWPDPAVYLATFPRFVRALAGKAFAHGSVYYAEGYAGAALWLPPDVRPDDEALPALFARTVPGARRKDAVPRWALIEENLRDASRSEPRRRIARSQQEIAAVEGEIVVGERRQRLSVDGDLDGARIDLDAGVGLVVEHVALADLARTRHR